MATVPSADEYKACPSLDNSFLSKFLEELMKVNPQSAIFTAIENTALFHQIRMFQAI